MLSKTPISEYIQLGEAVSVLNNSPKAQLDDYLKEIEDFLRRLGACHLPAARMAATALNAGRIRYDIPKRTISDRDLQRLKGMITSVTHSLYHEAAGKESVILRTGDVSDSLRSLPSKLTLTECQEQLLVETIRCLECEAYRSAAVMGWNLAFDYIRQWVFDRRLEDFNALLVNLFPDKRTIREYNDFLIGDAPAEFQCLMMWHDSRLPNGPILGNKLYDDLCQYLRLRNQYAHASDVTPSMHQSNSYIENLINIISRPPFF